MTNTTIDPRTRVRQLFDRVVTSDATGKPLGYQAKLGRVIAACRGHVSTVVTIQWNGIKPEAVREALDAIRSAE